MFSAIKLMMGANSGHDAIMVAGIYSSASNGYANFPDLLPTAGTLIPDDFIVPGTIVRYLTTTDNTIGEYELQLAYGYPDGSSLPPYEGWSSVHIWGDNFDATLVRQGEGTAGPMGTLIFSDFFGSDRPLIDGKTYYLKYT